ncbi:MAG TPA: hypothetical protein VGX23_08825 [Actinocrinis sp.]|nr:hypothetical protein [Actinocrinis sp.]
MQSNGTSGLTTILCEHVERGRGDTIDFHYPAKGGLDRVLTMVDEQADKAVATLLTAVALAVSKGVAHGPPSARRHADVRAVKEVAHYLGNTPAVCRASYINPRIFELFEHGRTIAPALGELRVDGRYGRPATQGAVEKAILDLLA